jgi:hypothetical protein
MLLLFFPSFSLKSSRIQATWRIDAGNSIVNRLTKVMQGDIQLNQNQIDALKQVHSGTMDFHFIGHQSES